MSQQTPAQRWCSIILLGLLLGLLIAFGIPAVAYRVSLAVERGRTDAIRHGLEGRLADLNDTSEAFRMVSEQVRPSVVHVNALRSLGGHTQLWEMAQHDRSQQTYQQTRQGSGLIIDRRGLVLTNNHLVSGAEQLQVHLSHPAGEFRASLVGFDAGTDLALLKFDPLGAEIFPAKLGDSDALAVGDWVLAIGNPYGLDQSVTAGIVSAKGRRVLPEVFDFQDFIQTDAAINPGNSGGPLVNLRGEVVGINTASLGEGNRGIGFAIPSNLAQRAIEDFTKYGQIVRGSLGVFLHPVDPETLPGLPASKFAVHVDHAIPGHAADKGGLQAGDVIIDSDDFPFATIRDLQRRIAVTTPDTEVLLSVYRGGKLLKKRVKVEKAPPVPYSLPGEQEWGLRFLTHYTPEIARALGLDYTEGVLIQDVHPQRPTAKVLSPGDVIVAVNDTPTPTLDILCRELNRLNLKSRITLRVRTRNGEKLVVLNDE